MQEQQHEQLLGALTLLGTIFKIHTTELYVTMVLYYVDHLPNSKQDFIFPPKNGQNFQIRFCFSILTYLLYKK